MTNPHTATRISATIKFPESKRYAADNPWLVFEGSDPDTVKALVAEAFSMEDTFDLFATVANAQAQASAVGNVVRTFPGATVVADEESAPAEEAPAQDGDAYVRGLIENATTMEELTEVWSKHRTQIENTPLFDLMGERSKSLG